MTKMSLALDDPFYDNIHLALGRPKEPLGPTYRNYYAAPTGERIELEMAASNKWEVVTRQDDSKLTVYAVTHQGRWALHNYLKKRKS
jgi:hypothetical protein